MIKDGAEQVGHKSATGEKPADFLHSPAQQIVPEKPAQKALDAPIQDKLLLAFDAAYYLSKNPDVLKSKYDPLQHFLKFGWKENRRPNGWFDPIDYVARHPELVGVETNPFLHFLTYRDRLSGDLDRSLHALQKNRILYWMDKYQEDKEGLRPLIVSSKMPNKADLALVKKHFDAEYYIAQNPELVDKWVSPLLHFMTLGWMEMRDPSPAFSTSCYLSQNEDVRREGLNPLVHYHRHGYREKWRQSVTVADAEILALFEDDAALKPLIEKAKQLDPTVVLPNRQRRITSPLKALRRANVAESLRQKFAEKIYKCVVTVPNFRMSDANHVATVFAHTLASVRDPSAILIIVTDSSEGEHIEDIPEKLDVYDFAKEAALLGPEHKARALVDVMRGVNCRTVINVNSHLAWEAMSLFGRQLHHEFSMVTYLFAWDENNEGDRVGNRLKWLRDTADQHHLLLTDTKNLADDLCDRLGFNQENGDAQVMPLYTPITVDKEITANPAKPDNRAGHFLWVGHFDPQNRLDILIEIACANPDMTFDVYSKAAASDDDFASYDPPDNVSFKDTLIDLQDVLNTPYSGFLCTAQWGGIPTILVEMAAAGVPVIAPDIGGVSEFLDDTTGWLVSDYKNVGQYSAALVKVASDPEHVRTCVQALQFRLKDQFSLAGYTSSIKKMAAAYGI